MSSSAVIGWIVSRDQTLSCDWPGDAHSAANGGPVSQQLGQVEGAGRGEEAGKGEAREGETGEGATEGGRGKIGRVLQF